MEQQKMYCTVVSIVPFPIDEEKPGLYPGRFRLDAAKLIDDKTSNNELGKLFTNFHFIPELLHIGDSVHYIEVDIDRTLAVTDPPHKVAASIVIDYADSQLGVNNENLDSRGPGIFWVPGYVDYEELLKKHTKELYDAQERQSNWFFDMVKIADDDWEQTHKHQAINNSQRFAAKYLNLDRPWVVVLPDSKSTLKCPACKTVQPSDIVICPTCKCIIDMEAYKGLTFVTDVVVTSKG